MDEQQNQTRDGMSDLTHELARLNNSRFMRLHESWLKLIWIQLLKGLALGLGTVIGATFLVSVAVLVLTNIDFIPIIGEWAAQIAEQMNQAK